MLKKTESRVMDVIVDALVAQGRGNLAVRLVEATGQMLPEFEAGAHVDLHLPGNLVRQYSIASSVQQRQFYWICVRKEVASRGGSAYVHERLRVGERLRMGAPRNLFALEPESRHSILLAAGIGITPLLSMAHALESMERTFELHYFVRERVDAAFARRLQKGFRHGTVQLHSSAEGRSARTALPESLKMPDAAKHLYMCGPHGFMAHVQAQALLHGWETAHVHQEAFAPVVSADAAMQMCEDQPFEVEMASSGQVFTIPVGRSIAHTLMAQGVDVPLSCEMGICGACLTPVLDGEPDHRDSVQSEAEKSSAQPHVALCCSRSRSPRMVLAL